MASADNRTSRRNHDRDIWGFFAISHGWSWIFWGVPLIRGGDIWEYPDVLFVYLGGLGPPLAGITMTYLVLGRQGLRELWRRIADFRLIPPGWYAVIFLLIPLVTVTAITIALLTGASSDTLNADRLLEAMADPFGVIYLALAVFLFGPMPEEIGWRGYVLDRLQERWNPLASSVILGTAWGVWHIPLFFIHGYYGPSGPPDPFLFFYNIILASILMTWICNNNRRSVLAAMLFHFMINLTGELVPVPYRVDILKTILLTGVVVFTILAWGSAAFRKDLPGNY